MFKTEAIFPATDKPAQKALTALLALIAFTLPFKFLVNIFIVIALLAWLFNDPYKALFAKNKFRGIFIAIIAFYFLHILSFFYTSNIQETFTNLETKISLVIFPLIFYTGNYAWPQMKFFVKCFVMGCLVCCFLCLGRAAYLSLDGAENYFFYEKLSWFQHPSYLSMYLTFCCVALLQKNMFTRFQNILLLLFFTFFVLLLSSKTGIAIHFLFLLLVGISYFFKRGSYLKVFIFTVSVISALMVLVYTIKPLKERFRNVMTALRVDKVDKTATESTAVRMLIWGEAKEIIRNNPMLGVSPGDANDALYESYKQNGLTGAYERKLNAHSQYFQTGVGLGLVGLASLMTLFILPVFNKPRRLLVFFLLITAVNFLTESMLQTMAGSIFFGYFYALLSFDKEIDPSKTSL